MLPFFAFRENVGIQYQKKYYIRSFPFIFTKFLHTLFFLYLSYALALGPEVYFFFLQLFCKIKRKKYKLSEIKMRFKMYTYRCRYKMEVSSQPKPTYIRRKKKIIMHTAKFVYTADAT